MNIYVNSMVLVGAVILTHGTMPFDGVPDSPSEACQERYKTLDPTIRDKCSKVSYITACYVQIKNQLYRCSER